MKRVALILALITLLTVALTVIPVGAASPLDDFTMVEKPEASTIRKTSFRFCRVWGVENPVGQWNPDDYGAPCFNSAGTYVDANNAAVVLWYNDYDRRTLTEVVFADLYTSSGAGDMGRTRINSATWDKVTLVVSDDFLNWREVDFIVGYHYEQTPITTQDQYGQNMSVDLYWHLILEEVTTAKYFAIHGGEPKGWDADDHSPRLGIFMDNNHFYGVNTSDQETDLGDIRYVYVNEDYEQGTVQNVIVNADGTLTHDGFQARSGIWHTPIFDGTTKTFPYVDYKTPINANEMIIADFTGWVDEARTTPKYTDYEDLEIYYSNDVSGTWTKIETTVVPYNCDRELKGTWAQGFRFQFEETVTAQYFMLYDPDPKANELSVTGNTFYAVFDPSNGTAAPPTTDAPETNAPETNAPETNAPETNAPETNAPETNAPETNAPETDPVEAPAENDVPWLYIVVATALVVVVVVVIVVLAKKKK